MLLPGDILISGEPQSHEYGMADHFLTAVEHVSPKS
jgi:hypothetical protein